MIERLVSPANRFFHRSTSLRFLVIGVINTLFGMLMFMFLLWLGFGIALGNALSLVAGILFSYQTQGTIVFKHKSLAAFGRFVLMWTIIYFVNLSEVKFLIWLELNKYLAVLIATVPTTIISFFIQKLFVFRAPNEAEPTERLGMER